MERAGSGTAVCTGCVAGVVDVERGVADAAKAGAGITVAATGGAADAGRKTVAAVGNTVADGWAAARSVATGADDGICATEDSAGPGAAAGVAWVGVMLVKSGPCIEIGHAAAD